MVGWIDIFTHGCLSAFSCVCVRACARSDTPSAYGVSSFSYLRACKSFWKHIPLIEEQYLWTISECRLHAA